MQLQAMYVWSFIVYSLDIQQVVHNKEVSLQSNMDWIYILYTWMYDCYIH